MTRSISVMWFRLDLRLADNPALQQAIKAGPDGVLPLVVLDPYFWRPGASVRQHYLVGLLRDFSERIGGLHIVQGNPSVEIPRIVASTGASSVHISSDFTPYGAERDAQVEAALGDTPLHRTGSAYAVSPGRIHKADGSPYRVFTPFYRAWSEHGWRAPAALEQDIPWLRMNTGGVTLPDAPVPPDMQLPPVGEAAALASWDHWLHEHSPDYHRTRDLPGQDVTSRMSTHLKWGTIHPRTLLSGLAEHPSEGADAYQRELGFREFYADVLHHRPDSASGYYDRRFEAMTYDEPGDGFVAWQEGRTGYPIVDAGMRQLRAEGWMHNRVRMIVASFLVKDLHVEWTHGARHFLEWLVDADLASNQHGWQWVAGCGTDASPYFRIFNPITQSKKFDPDGAYISRWVPELSELPAAQIHEPWKLPNPPLDYPAPLVDHAEERAESLRRYAALTTPPTVPR